MRVILFTGKGGVGKTTAAAGTAVASARAGQRTLVLSTDAAHSLADTFDVPVGADPTPVTELPQLLGAPERIEAGWWEGEDSSRDYYLARTAEGARWWLYRDASNNRWYLQGLWA